MQTLGEFLESIANAIRNKKGTTGSIKATDFANEIESIPKAVLQTSKEVSLTSSAAATYTPDTGYDGIASITVTPVTQTKSVSLTKTSATDVTVDSGKVGMTKVTVTTGVYRTLAHTTSYVGKGDMGSKTFTVPSGVTTAKIIVSCQFPAVYSFTPKYSTTSGSIAWSNDNLKSSDNFYHRCTVLTLTKSASASANVTVRLNDDNGVGAHQIHFHSVVVIY